MLFRSAGDLPDLDYSQFDLVLISDIESNTVKYIRESLNTRPLKNYLFALGGVSLDYTMTDNMIYRPWWCFNILNYNQYQDTDTTSKPFLFDVLLGARRPHRDFLMARLQMSELLEKSIVTYREVFTGSFADTGIDTVTAQILGNTELQWPYVSGNLKPEWEVADAVDNTVSYIVPWQIYANTKYSVIAETKYSNDLFFLTEKTTKAMFAQRLFVVFSCKSYLENLRNLGFKTFSNIIDESYDNIEDPGQRIGAVVSIVEQLANLTHTQQQNMRRDLQHIVKHNFDHLFFELRPVVVAELTNNIAQALKSQNIHYNPADLRELYRLLVN